MDVGQDVQLVADEQVKQGTLHGKQVDCVAP
jgi:hypothetical protein